MLWKRSERISILGTSILNKSSKHNQQVTIYSSLLAGFYVFMEHVFVDRLNLYVAATFFIDLSFIKKEERLMIKVTITVI